MSVCILSHDTSTHWFSSDQLPYLFSVYGFYKVAPKPSQSKFFISTGGSDQLKSRHMIYMSSIINQSKYQDFVWDAGTNIGTLFF